jgi:cation diffusion facilitator CzcD-associated flavoprotein CzcO
MGSHSYNFQSDEPRVSLIQNRSINEARPLKVMYIGAGVSGIIAAIEFLKAVPSLELVIYEKNPELGGTWYENRCVYKNTKRLSIQLWTFG